jgi:hypothetical protein
MILRDAEGLTFRVSALVRGAKYIQTLPPLKQFSDLQL